MKIIGFVLFLLGVTLAGGYAAAIPQNVERGEDAPAQTASQRISAWWDIGGPPFLGGMALMIVGAVLARSARKPADEATGEEGPYRGGPPSSDASEMLKQISDDLDALPSAFTDKDETAQAVLDGLLEEGIPQFLDRREAMIENMGLEKFAEMIGQFAMMERGIARAWSAMTDECYAEVGPSLDRAKSALASARDVL